jgi:hypothetical protein
MEERTVAKLVETINKHLPLKKKTLKELMNEEDPHIRCGDGSIHYFEEDELLYLIENVPEEEHGRFFVPILLEMTRFQGNTIVIVRDPLHKALVSKILGIPEKNRELVLYLPEIRELRRLLPTTTQYMFRLSSI